ncbi:MAG: hypothetical protein ACRDNZ_20555 [Streptosporangiaceae bacterium]
MADILALSDERDAWQRVSLAREREAFDRGYRRGHEDGYRAGYAARWAALEADWREAARHVAHGDPRSYAELQERRRGNAA